MTLGPSALDRLGARIENAPLVARARLLAAGLRGAGLRPGERVLFAVRDGPGQVALFLALMELRAVIVPLTLGGGQELFDAQMALIAPRWVIAESILLAAARNQWLRRLLSVAGVEVPAFTSVNSARTIRVGPWLPGLRDALSLAVLERRGALSTDLDADTAPQADDPLLIVFTSGTTGAPKAVVHTQGSIAKTLDVVGERLGIGAGDTLLSYQLHLLIPALSAGARGAPPPSGRFSPAKFIQALVRHGATHTILVPAACAELCTYLTARGEQLPETLRHLLIGGAPVRVPFLRRFASVVPEGTEVTCVYGMTEMLPIATIGMREKLAYDGAGDCLGTPVAGVRVRTAEDGELIVSGAHLFAGYVGGSTPVEHATGDLGRLEDGRIVLLGRKKDMIIRGDYNIYPELHEPVVEGIAGVRRCAMVGVFDEVTADERVVLFVEPEGGAGTEEDTQRFQRHVWREVRSGRARLDAWALPDEIVIAPLVEGGRSRKLDKRALAAMVRERRS